MYIQQQAANHAILNMQRQLPGDTLILPVVVHIINSNPSSVRILTFSLEFRTWMMPSANPVITGEPGCRYKDQVHVYPKSAGWRDNYRHYTHNFIPGYLTHNMDTEEDQLKNLIQWDPVRYINIWLVSNLHGEILWISCGAGSGYRWRLYHHAPGGGATDGIVVGGFKKFLRWAITWVYTTRLKEDATMPIASPVATGFCDTPPDKCVRASFPAHCRRILFYRHPVFLLEWFLPVNVPDQIANFMDYSNGSCTNQFTHRDRQTGWGQLYWPCDPVYWMNVPHPVLITSMPGSPRTYLIPSLATWSTLPTHQQGASGYEWLCWWRIHVNRHQLFT